jgi:chitinase
VNYTANWWTQGNEPDKNNGGSGTGEPWTSNGACGGGATATATKTATKTATATAIKTATGTATKTATATATKTATKTATATATKTATAVPPPGKIAAPYLLTDGTNLASLSSASGLKYFTLAFVISSGCSANWNGDESVSSESGLVSEISALRSAGGDVIVSFGGAGGTELGEACSSASTLQAQYQAVITKYGLKYIDLDIEGSDISDSSATDRRNTAMASLQAANPGLSISYTLPVDPGGLESTATSLLSNAHSHGLTGVVVNVMAMDYGGSYEMGTAAETAASASWSQVQASGLSGASISICPQIGDQDSPDQNDEVFTIADAQNLVAWAKGQSYISRLTFWEVGRDNGSCAGNSSAAAGSDTCSGLSQSTYQFSQIFAGF